MARRSGKHPVILKTSMYVPIPFYLKEEQGINEKSVVEYERIGKNGLIVRIGDVK
jgi:hypothetical protein